MFVIVIMFLSECTTTGYFKIPEGSQLYLHERMGRIISKIEFQLDLNLNSKG